MTYPEAIKFLYGLRWFGTKFGLDNTLNLAALAGNPQKQLRFIHVAGTNGKGSTCAILESIYRAAGFKTGLFTSPHLVSFRERIQVNRQLIPESEVVRLVEQLRQLIASQPAPDSTTFFEFVTVMALDWFAEQACDVVLWETGLGGRLDATNIVTPLASVITNVALDHQQWLGNNIRQIAAEKAGIIKTGVPVITAVDQPEALDIIKHAATEADAELSTVGCAQQETDLVAVNRFPLAGEHQLVNAQLALTAIRVLQPTLPVSPDAIRSGLEHVVWPGRFQLVSRPNGNLIILDGAHNPAGVASLLDTLRARFPDARPAIVLGIFCDKDWQSICAQLAPIAKRLLAVAVASDRTVAPEELTTFLAKVSPATDTVACSDLKSALGMTRDEKLVLITGSLQLIGEAIELLELMDSPHMDERALNEWGASMRVQTTSRLSA